MATAPYFPFPSAATFPPPIFPGGYSYPSPFPAPASGYFSTFVHPHPPPPPAPAYPCPPPTYAYTTSTPAPAYDHSTLPSTIHLTYSQPPPPPEITRIQQRRPPEPASSRPPLPTSPSPSPSVPPSTSIAPPRSAGARAPPAARGPVPIVPATHLRLEQLPAVVSLPEQAAVPSTSNGAAELGHSSGRSPYPTTSAPHAGSRAPQPVHAPEPPFAPAAFPSKAAFHSSASRTQLGIEPLLKLPNRDVLPNRDDAAVQAAVDEQVPSKNASHRWVQRELVKIQARLDQQQARERTALISLQGELAKLKSAASALAVAMGMQTTDSPVTGSSPPVASAQFRSAATNASSSSDTSAAASLSASSLSSPVIASFAVPTLTSHSTVPADHANVASQVLEEMPQSYGLHNLTQRIVFRADGTEHSYFTLPADYPLERAVSEPMFDVYDEESASCSNESARVFATTPEQQPYEDMQQESGQSRKCFSKPSENPLPEVISEFTLTDKVDFSVARSITFKQGPCIPQVLEYAYTPGCAIEDVLFTDHKWNMLLSEKEREVWDPGATEFPFLFMTTAGASKLQCPDVCKLAIAQKLDVKFVAKKVPIFQSHIMRSDAFSMGWTEMNAAALDGSSGTCFSGCKCLPFCIPKIYVYWDSEIGMTTFFSWDPGVLKIKDGMLDKCIVQHHVQFLQQRTELLILISEACIQYYAQNGANSELHGISLLLQRATHSSQDNYLRSLQYQAEYYQVSCLWTLSVSSIKRVQWDPGVKVSLYCWLDTLTVWSEIITPLFCTHTPELARDQNQVTSASYVWDPGTESLLFLCKLLLIRMIQLVDSAPTTLACYFFLVARLPPTQVASYCLSNIKVGKLTSRYLGFHPNQIDSWACMISNGITSSEYAYPLDFHYDQWEFFNQQDVHEHYSTKHFLLSSQKYLLIREMDIIFITYLPP